MKDRFAVAHVTASDWQQAVEQMVGALGPVSATANLGFLYATDSLSPDLNRILRALGERTAVRHWVGSVGSGIVSSGLEIYDQPSIAVMLAGFPEDSFRIIPTITASSDSFLAATRTWRERYGSSFGVVHGDPRNGALPALISQLAQGLDSGFLVGGLCSSRHGYLQVADQVTEGGLSGVLFSREVPVASGLTQGCSLIGERHRVTDCHRNVIIELDGRPALDVFREEIGEVLARDLSRVAGYIFAALLIAGSDTGDYLVRNLVGIDPESRLLAIGQVLEPGDVIQLARRDGNTAREDLLRMLRELKGRAARAPRGGIYYSCVGRGRYLFGEDSEELKIIRQELGDIPLVGFFANGEISRNQLYGYTGVLTLFL